MDEMSSLMKNHTWLFEKLPKGRNLYTTCGCPRSINNNMTKKSKSRLEVKGFQ